MIIDTDAICVYVHWPYCKRICPYCDFNVVRDRTAQSNTQIDAQTRLKDAIIKDLLDTRARLGLRTVKSLYFGGGTPSLMRPEWVAEIIDTLYLHFKCDADLEITIEANPTDAETQKYREFARIGINRLSLGVQALDAQELHFLGRDHSAIEALKALEAAQCHFKRTSIDLIYGLPDQSLGQWVDTLNIVKALGVEHISPYHLTIEPKTAFGRASRRGTQKGGFSPQSEDTLADFFEATYMYLEDAGFMAYEVSNHALNSDARSRHNVNIWRGMDYVGIGPGAHGRLTLDGVRYATYARPDLRAYCDAIFQHCDRGEIYALSVTEAQEERLMLGLRTLEGVDVRQIEGLDIVTRSQALIASEFMELSAWRLSPTPKGLRVLDRILYEILA